MPADHRVMAARSARNQVPDGALLRWKPDDSRDRVKLAEQAFITWKSIRNEQIAQAYLVSLVVKKRD